MPKIEAENAIEKSEGLNNWIAKGEGLVGSIVNNSYIKFSKLSLKGLESVTFSAFYAAKYPYEGDLEIREGSPNGTIIGKTHLEYYHETKGIIKYYQIPVKTTAEESAIYLVFKNTIDKEQYITNANWILLNYKH